MNEQITLALIGGGNRGMTYARLAALDPRVRFTAFADPSAIKRQEFASTHDVAGTGLFADWRDLAQCERVADAVIIATQDAMHYECAAVLAEKGYHVLVEKPLALEEHEAEHLVSVAEEAGVILAVCHVLRHAAYTRTLKRLLAEGAIGDLVNVEHLEPVGWWHFAHSYVRGNWRRESESSFVLLTKSIHDIDWVNHLLGQRPSRVSSFGSLSHFRAEKRPEGAGDRCTACSIEPTCSYSASRLYLSFLGDPGRETWPLSVVTSDLTPRGVLDALETGPYGRCVYASDNDVVDHQVVNIEYETGVTVSFTMSAFTPYMFRRTRLFGTDGYLECDGRTITVSDFRNGEQHVVSTTTGDDPSAGGGHGGADGHLIRAFLDAVMSGDPGPDLAVGRDSLTSYRLTWAAERSRRSGQVVRLD